MPVTFTKLAMTLHSALTSLLCVRSISKDLVPFDVPVTFTIQVHDPMVDADGFLRYAQRLNSLTEAEFYTILAGIIHGQTRILAGGHSVLFFTLKKTLVGICCPLCDIIILHVNSRQCPMKGPSLLGWTASAQKI